MSDPALRMTGLRAVIEPARGGLRVQVTAGTARLSLAGLAALVPTGAPVEIAGIHGDRLLVRWKAFTAELLPEGTPTGALRLRGTAVRAGFLPVPLETLGLALALLPRREGLRVDGRSLEVDLQRLAGAFHVDLPPLQRVRLTEAGLELVFGDPSPRPPEA